MNKNQVKTEARRVIAEMEVWGLRVQRQDSAIVHRASDLDRPPAIAGTHYCTEGLAWRSLATAGEHAGNAHQIIEYSGGGVPTKPFLTGGRTALLCGARALYVLEPDDTDARTARTLQLLAKEFSDIKAVIDEWEKAGGPVDAVMENNRKAAQDNAVKCSQALTALGKKAGSQQSDTAILAATSKYLAGGTRYDPRVNVMSMWHLSSGTAHGRMWAWGSGLEDESIETQLAYVWSNPLGLMNKAWELWNRRRGT